MIIFFSRISGRGVPFLWGRTVSSFWVERCLLQDGVGHPKILPKGETWNGTGCRHFLVYVGLCVLLAFGPWNTVRSAIGTLSDSPLADGFWGVCSLGVALPSIVYGFASDSYLDDSDVVEGMAYLYKSRATYFVVLLFITLFSLRWSSAG